MANYHGRRAPNVSQYINNLNTIPSAADMAAAQQEFPDFNDDLSLFTNTQFFDFDMAENVANMPDFDVQTHGQNIKSMGFVNQPPQLPYNDFSFSQSGAHSINHASPHSLPTSPPNGLPFANGQQQSQPTVPTAAQFAQHQFQANPQTGDKRTASDASLSGVQDLEDVSRAVAEEDKRRRNTAASARFRVKKKQREQALEKSAKEMSDKVSILEARVGQLEMENKWLKGLITEKNVRLPTMNGVKGKKIEKAPGGEEQTDEGQVKASSVSGTKDNLDAQSPEAVENVNQSPEEKKRGVGTDEAAVEA